MVPLVSVVIPSRLAPVRTEVPDALWLERAIESIKQQTVFSDTRIEVIVGIDHDKTPPEDWPYAQEWVSFAVAQAGEGGQAAALNAAAAKAKGEYLALLEDDDRWRPQFLMHALKAIIECDFVSSNQLEIPPDSDAGQINDFPTPSGWFMRRDLWDEIGGMDTSYRYHLDNDWLGRLSDVGKRRVHMVEKTAAQHLEELKEKRPFLYSFVNAKPGYNFVVRHEEMVPMVLRTANPQGGMAMIRDTVEASLRSREEEARLKAAYGRFPY